MSISPGGGWGVLLGMANAYCCVQCGRDVNPNSWRRGKRTCVECGLVKSLVLQAILREIRDKTLSELLVIQRAIMEIDGKS